MSREGAPILSRRRVAQISVVLLLSLLATTLIFVAQGTHQTAPPLYRDGIVLLAFHPGVQDAQQKAILFNAGAIELKRIGAGVHVVAVGHGRVPEVVASLKTHREVRYAEPDYLQSLAAGSLPTWPVLKGFHRARQAHFRTRLPMPFSEWSELPHDCGNARHRPQ